MENVVTDLSPPNSPSQFHVVMGKFHQIFQNVIDSIFFVLFGYSTVLDNAVYKAAITLDKGTKRKLYINRDAKHQIKHSQIEPSSQSKDRHARRHKTVESTANRKVLYGQGTAENNSISTEATTRAEKP